ncbi:MAG: hypothetical protein ABS52_08425 [Gemmatimonadetes bacterium SCN 70-22]|nr:MAG: hypothetical protein ABS52_08425 [Gemmatimonadetes bacterium SCN 70-22]
MPRGWRHDGAGVTSSSPSTTSYRCSLSGRTFRSSIVQMRWVRFERTDEGAGMTTAYARRS